MAANSSPRSERIEGRVSAKSCSLAGVLAGLVSILEILAFTSTFSPAKVKVCVVQSLLCVAMELATVTKYGLAVHRLASMARKSMAGIRQPVGRSLCGHGRGVRARYTEPAAENCRLEPHCSMGTQRTSKTQK